MKCNDCSNIATEVKYNKNTFGTPVCSKHSRSSSSGKSEHIDLLTAMVLVIVMFGFLAYLVSLYV